MSGNGECYICRSNDSTAWYEVTEEIANNFNITWLKNKRWICNSHYKEFDNKRNEVRLNYIKASIFGLRQPNFTYLFKIKISI